MPRTGPSLGPKGGGTIRSLSGTGADLTNEAVTFSGYQVDRSQMNAMVPGAPQNLEAAGGTGKVTLDWAAPAGDGAAASPLLQLIVVCMQVDKGLPLRGARYFSRPKDRRSQRVWYSCGRRNAY